MIQKTGRSSAWLERLLWEQEAEGSNPFAPIKWNRSLMVKHQTHNLRESRSESLRFH